MTNTELIMIDHAEYPKTLKSKSESSLRYIISDCKNALQAYPENPKSGYYQDEIHYCALELAARRKNTK